MKILIVSSVDPIFLNLAKKLYLSISHKHEKLIVKENVSISIFRILVYRIKRFGLLSGLSQFIFKIFDILFLRKKFTKIAIGELGKFDCKEISSLSSRSSRELTSKYDVVICIATSIINQKTLETSKYGFINIHPGILPYYRGTGNLWAVLNKDWENLGATCHWMTRKIDVGKVISITKVHANYLSLWELNITAIRDALIQLSIIINNDELLNSSVMIDQSKAKYYSWYGIGDFIKFWNIVRNQK